MATLIRHLSPATGIIHRSWNRTFFRWASSPDTPAKNEETDDLMTCTKLKFIYDSAAQMKLRQLNFDVDALKKVAVRASGSTNCSDIKVLAEGTFNRVFSLTMDAGMKEIIVKMPFPHAGPQKLLTNSEVATMDFVCTRFKAPVPKVLAWDPSPYNEIGNEYIIMEKLSGQHLHAMQEFMDGKESFVKDIAKLCTDMASVPFSQYGSIYYKEDLDPSLQGRPLYAPGVPEDEFSKKFRIGPSTKRQFYADGRANLPIDRGPWKDVHSYMKAHGQCEIAWINKFAGSRKNPKIYYGAGRTTPKQHIILIEKWMSMLPALIPLPSALSHMKHCKNPQLLNLNKPTLMHTDLRSDNIFVIDDVNMKLCGLIDLQSVSIRPAFEARLPPFLPWHPPVVQDIKLVSKPTPESPVEGDAVSKLQAQLFLDHLYQQHPAMYAASMVEYLRHLANPSIRDTWSTWQEGLSGLHLSVRHLMETYKSGIIPTNPKHPKIPLTFKPGEVEVMDTEAERLALISKIRKHVNKELARQGVDQLDSPGVRFEDFEVVESVLQVAYDNVVDSRSPDQVAIIDEHLWPFRDNRHSNYSQSTTCRPT